MSKKKTKIELYAEAPYIQGYNSAQAGEEFFNPYANVENAEADAEGNLDCNPVCKLLQSLG